MPHWVVGQCKQCVSTPIVEDISPIHHQHALSTVCVCVIPVKWNEIPVKAVEIVFETSVQLLLTNGSWSGGVLLSQVVVPM